ncbi:MAG: 50S ribosomal protein L20 [Candidatus Pacebacteria bacterium]|nr:50S ribosomal protein L20 [Candidatus Paceibacterota bacterium]
MTRVKKGTTSLKKRKNILKMAKGRRYGLSTKQRQANEGNVHAAMHAFRHRRKKKGVFRRLWQTRMGAALKELDLSYSRFIDILTKKNIGLNRKVLSEIAQENPESFERIVNQVK